MAIKSRSGSPAATGVGTAAAAPAATAPSATVPPGPPPPALCSALAKLQNDLFPLPAIGAVPKIDKVSVFGDGFRIGFLGSLAGDPYDSQVQTFARYARADDLTDAVRALGVIDRECGMPAISLQGQLA